MGNNFDLLILACLAGFIIYKLLSVLGKSDESGGLYTNLVKDVTENDGLIIINESQLEEIEKKLHHDDNLVKSQTQEVQNVIAEITKMTRNFSLSIFLTRAQKAFEMVIEAYNNRDLETLKDLLSKEVYNIFVSNLSKRNENEKPEITIIRFASSEIKNALLKNSMASITIKFVSEQINIVRDLNNKIIKGSASEINVVEDEWTFTKNLNSKDNKWLITATS